MSRLTRILLPVIVAFMMAACATTPVATFYALSAFPAEPSGQAGKLTLAVGPIDLPRYLDRPQIVTRSGDNRLVLEEFHRWGGALDEEVNRVLADRLGSRLDTDRVYRYPSRIVADLDYRVALDIRMFDGPLGGEVRLDAAWSIIADRNGEVLLTRQSVYRSAAADGSYATYVTAMSELVARLGDDLALGLVALSADGRP